MARYISAMTVSFPISQLQQLLIHILEQCRLDVIHCTNDYIIGREHPGKVTYNKLVFVEIFISQSLDRGNEINLRVVVKNEELPLQADNHCYEVFNTINETFLSNREWQFIEQVIS